MNAIPIRDLSEAASSAVLDQLAEGIIITDASGRIRYVNEAARAIHGVAELDVEPEDYAETYHLFTVDGEPYPFADLPLVRAVGGATVIDEPWLIRRPDGSEVYAVGSAKPLLGPVGEQVGAVLTLRDESVRREAQMALEEREETIRAFFETAGIYTAVIDLHEDDFHLPMGNRRMATVFGQRRLEGQSGRALVGDTGMDEIMAFLRGCAEKSGPQFIEYPWRLANEERWFVATVNALPTGPAGVPRLFLASLDITDRKATERELAQALQLKDVLLHEVNHRVKNSLQIVTSLLALQERAGDETLASNLREARSRVETVARVHERLYATSAHDKVEVVSYLHDLVEEVMSAVTREDRVRMRFDSDGSELMLGVEHSVPLALIVTELVLNARKYAFPDERPGIVTVTTACRDGSFIVEVSDDGVGMSDGQADPASGLGMRIVSALSAQLRAETAYLPAEAGTRFQLMMPLDDC